MDQKQLLDVAKSQQGLTSDYSLAQRLGVTPARVSDLRKGRRDAELTEIFMLADMAGIDPHIAAAAVHREREKNPAKRAYWEKISMQFAMAMLMVSLISIGFPTDANAQTTVYPSINYAKL
jgi:hypothetical protein